MATHRPDTVAICHCDDCRRWTGSPLPAFAAFPIENVMWSPPPSDPLEAVPGVKRWMCKRCGSPLAATFDYLPGQVYVPLGVMDDAGTLAPDLHCHTQVKLPWLHMDDGLPRYERSGRDSLKAALRS